MAKKESLSKLIDFVAQTSNKSENEWFRIQLVQKLKISEQETDSIKEIYEYCIRAIIRSQAEHFYQNFRLPEIKDKLINDFVRMEQFRRQDNFEDFSLAMFQQVEHIVNRLCSKDEAFCRYIKSSKDIESHKIKNKDNGRYEPHRLSELLIDSYKSAAEITVIFDKPIIQWEFKRKFKAVLYYFYYDKKIFSFYEFYAMANLAVDLQQARNLNHRGGYQYEKQAETINKVINEQDRYYYRFLGFLEDFTNKINDRITSTA